MKTTIAIIAALLISIISFSASAQTSRPPDNYPSLADTQAQSAPQEKTILPEKPTKESGFEKNQEKPAPEKKLYDYPYNKKKIFEEYLQERKNKKIA